MFITGLPIKNFVNSLAYKFARSFRRDPFVYKKQYFVENANPELFLAKLNLSRPLSCWEGVHHLISGYWAHASYKL